jgi:hypothetical protein
MSEEKTVYFLGAGASNAFDFKLPTMRSFFQKRDPILKRFPKLHQFIQRAFPGIPIQKINLEDVISYLDLSVGRFGSFGERPGGSLLDARAEFDQCVRTKLDYERSAKGIWCSNLKKIFRGLRKTDTVVTLSYDLVAENTLNTISKEKEGRENHPLYDEMVNLLIESTIYDVAIIRRNSQSGLYLKLHGSIDWYRCPHRTCRNHVAITIPEKSQRDRRHLCTFCGARLEIAILPPTMSKVFERYPRLGVMWTLARPELSASTAVVFIGVSFAPSDYYLRWLIKSSLLEAKNKNKSIVVVDKCKQAVKRIKEIIGRQPESYYSSLKRYISSLGEGGS